MAASKVEVFLNTRYEVIGTYDDTHGTNVYNETTNDKTTTTGRGIVVGLTATDGETLDRQYDVKLEPGKEKDYATGLGDGRKVIVYKERLDSLLLPFDVSVTETAGS